MNFWILFAAIAILSGLLLDLTVLMIRAAIAKTKPWFFMPDEEGGIGSLMRRRYSNGFVIIGKGDNKRRYPVRAEARHLTRQGPVYIIGQQSGCNMRVPSKEEIKEKLGDDANAILAFEAVDPLLLSKVFERRQVQETIEGQMDKDDWKKSAILPLSIVAGLAVIALGVIATKLAGS